MNRWEILGLPNPFPKEPEYQDRPEFSPAEIADTIMVHLLEDNQRYGIGYVAVNLFTRGILSVDEPRIGLEEIARRASENPSSGSTHHANDRYDWRERQFKDPR